jgi:hypothetical protein
MLIVSYLFAGGPGASMCRLLCSRMLPGLRLPIAGGCSILLMMYSTSIPG